jgi:hypothetical protein
MMSFQLNFLRREKYDSRSPGINIRTTLRAGQLFINCEAKVDTGAEVCLFQRAIGETLEISIESGEKKRLETLTGVLTAFGHEVILEACGLQLQTIAYFAESTDVRRNLLGRYGWLQLIRLGLIDYDNELYLSLYDE